MKKLLTTVGLMVLAASSAMAGDAQMEPCNCPPPPPCAHRPAPPKIDLDKKLNLTEAQKTKAREIRIKGEQEIRPLFDKLKSKQEQKRVLLNSQIKQKEQIEMLDTLNDEISLLKKQIHEVRMKNMKEFESILTDKQRATLEKIKMESRKDFQKKHKANKGKPHPCPCDCHK